MSFCSTSTAYPLAKLTLATEHVLNNSILRDIHYLDISIAYFFNTKKEKLYPTYKMPYLQ